jgi:hypothetical protein
LRETPKAKWYQGWLELNSNNENKISYIEIYDWLRKELRYGKNPLGYMGDPQPSS